MRPSCDPRQTALNFVGGGKALNAENFFKLKIVSALATWRETVRNRENNLSTLKTHYPWITHSLSLANCAASLLLV